jgi:hypothetical protein
MMKDSPAREISPPSSCFIGTCVTLIPVDRLRTKDRQQEGRLLTAAEVQALCCKQPTNPSPKKAALNNSNQT